MSASAEPLRLAIIADTHMPRGPRRLPDRCLEELRGSDLIIHLGDFTAASVLEELERIGPRVEAIRGNVDDADLQARLPSERTLSVGGSEIALVHDAGPRAGRIGRLRRRFPGVPTVLFAHSHLPLCEHDDGFQIFNPGSPTERRRAPHRTMGIGEVAGGVLTLRHLVLG